MHLYFRDGRLRAGDELLMVNGKLLVGLTHQEAVATLRSATGLIQLVVASMVRTFSPSSFSFITTIIKSLYCFRGDQTWPSNGSCTRVFQTLSALVIYHRFYWRLLLNITLLQVCKIQRRYVKCSVWVFGLRSVLFLPIITSITVLLLQFSNVEKLDEQCQKELPKGISRSLKLCSQSQGWYRTWQDQIPK